MHRLLSQVFLSVLCSIAMAGADEPALKLVQTIPLDGVEGRMDHFGADPQRKRLYLAALGNNSLEVIDTDAEKRSRASKGSRSRPASALRPPAMSSPQVVKTARFACSTRT